MVKILLPNKNKTKQLRKMLYSGHERKILKEWTSHVGPHGAHLLYESLWTIIHNCQNVNRIMNRFLIFLYRVSYRIMYRKIHKHLIKFINIINIHI